MKSKNKADQVLVIEDNPGYARLLEEMLFLEAEGEFDVTHVTSLAAARNKITQEKFNVILVDLKITDSSGLDTMRAILTVAPDSPIVVLTGLDDVAISEQAIREGAQDFLIKGNFNARQLIKSIRYAKLRSGLHASIKQILESNRDIIVVLNDEKRVLYVNGIGRKTFGENAESILLDNIAKIDPGKELTEVMIESPDSKELYFEIRQTQIFWNEQESADLYYLHDVGLRKHAEKVLLQSNQEMEKLVAERTEELVRSNRALTIASGVNHELALDHDEQTLLARICNVMIESGGYDYASIYNVQEVNASINNVDSVVECHSGNDQENTVSADLLEKIKHQIAELNCPLDTIQILKNTKGSESAENPVDNTSQKGSTVVVSLSQGTEHYYLFVLHTCGSILLDNNEFELLNKTRASLAFGIYTARAQDETRKLGQVIEQTPDLVLITDCKGQIEYVNKAFENTTGFKKAEVIGKTPNIINSGTHDGDFFENMWAAILKGGVFRDILINRKKDGLIYYEEKTIASLKNHKGEITHFISTGKDVTDRLKAEERLHYLANYDVVTDLPNQALLLDRINQSIQRLFWHDRYMAIATLKIDHFKPIRDTMGHKIADDLICKISSELAGILRDGDTIARIESDVLSVLLDDIADVSDANNLINEIRSIFNEAIFINEKEYFVTSSIGISCYPQDGQNADELLRNSQAAMKTAVNKGGNCYEFFTSEMNSQTTKILTLETELRHAVKKQEFETYYQPFISLKTNKVIGVEVLLRWNHPKEEIVSPIEFIKVLEDTSLILPVGRWVLDEACLQHKEWVNLGLPPMIMAVNLSMVQFENDNVIQLVKDRLDKHKIDGNFVELEITESTFMKNVSKTISILQELLELGVKLSIDDFGTGYSSLSYLTRFPIHTLKIDRSFVKDIPDNQNNVEIVRAIIAIAKSLNLKVIAEGVETPAQMDYLRKQKCDIAQGYLFSRPLPKQEMTEFLISQFGLNSKMAGGS